MANDPFLDGPPLLVPVDPVEVHEPVRVRLQVLGPHAGEALDVAADPGAEVVHEGHLLQVDRIGGDGLVALVHEAEVPHEGVVGLLAVVHDGGAPPDVSLQGPVDSLGGWLAVLADDGHRLPERVDRDDDADLVLREAPPPRRAGLALDPRVLEVQQSLYRVRVVPLAAQPRGDRVPQLVELVGGQAVHEGAQVEGTALHAPFRHLGFPPGRPPPKMSPNKEEGGLSGGFVWRGHRTRERIGSVPCYHHTRRP